MTTKSMIFNHPSVQSFGLPHLLAVATSNNLSLDRQISIDPDSGKIIFRWNGIITEVGGGGGIVYNPEVISGKKETDNVPIGASGVSTSQGPSTRRFPEDPDDGDMLSFSDLDGTFDVRSFTLFPALSGELIMRKEDDNYEMDNKNQSSTLRFFKSINSWMVISGTHLGAATYGSGGTGGTSLANIWSSQPLEEIVIDSIFSGVHVLRDDLEASTSLNYPVDGGKGTLIATSNSQQWIADTGNFYVRVYQADVWSEWALINAAPLPDSSRAALSSEATIAPDVTGSDVWFPILLDKDIQLDVPVFTPGVPAGIYIEVTVDTQGGHLLVGNLFNNAILMNDVSVNLDPDAVSLIFCLYDGVSTVRVWVENQ